MQAIHNPLKFSSQEVGQTALGVIQGGEDTTFLIPGGPSQDVVDDLLPVTRVIDADAQSPEITAAQNIDDVAQTVVTSVTAPLLQTHGADGEIEIVMGHQNGLNRDSVITHQRS